MTFLRSALRSAPKRLAQRSYATASKEQLQRTGLYDFHVANGAKMVPFAGYEMPLAYGNIGQVDSHKHVRTHAGLFDVGHMVQSNFVGPTATAFLESITPSSLSTLPPHSSTLSVLLNANGGIIDDLIITKLTDSHYYVVTNAGRRAEDISHFTSQLASFNASSKALKEGSVSMELMNGWGLVALQGPEAASALQKLTDFDLKEITFGKSAWVTLKEGGFSKVHVARGGYTGEDGFEISIPPEETEAVTRLITSSPEVQLTGLGARDSLRLEAGMCLYGNDLDESISPIEAGLTWLIGKDRRGDENGFIGASEVLRQLKEGPTRRRVGFIVDGAPARQGAKVFAPSSEEPVGIITSGIPSPTLGVNIAMGYVKSGQHKKGTELEVEVRGKKRGAKVAGMPFVPAKYYRG